eukprot:471001_1
MSDMQSNISIEGNSVEESLADNLSQMSFPETLIHGHETEMKSEDTNTDSSPIHDSDISMYRKFSENDADNPIQKKKKYLDFPQQNSTNTCNKRPGISTSAEITSDKKLFLEKKKNFHTKSRPKDAAIRGNAKLLSKKENFHVARRKKNLFGHVTGLKNWQPQTQFNMNTHVEKVKSSDSFSSHFNKTISAVNYSDFKNKSKRFKTEIRGLRPGSSAGRKGGSKPKKKKGAAGYKRKKEQGATGCTRKSEQVADTLANPLKKVKKK